MNPAPVTVDVTTRVATAGDAAAVRGLICSARTPRYAGAAQKLVHRCGSVLAGTVTALERFHCLLFEGASDGTDTPLVGLSAMAQHDEGICDWIVMGIARERHRARVPDGRSLAMAMAEETARSARDQGYRHLVAQVHRNHRKSLHIVERLGFVLATMLDVDYGLYAVDLATQA